MSQNNFCPIPFGHTMISPWGDFQVCCQHITPTEHQVNINDQSYEAWRNNKYLIEVQQSFKENLRHPGCKKCWDQEDVEQSSYRQRVLKEYALFGINTVDDLKSYPVNVEINLGNLCNLKCIMCFESNSSALLAENIKLGINRYQQKEFQWSLNAFDNLEKMLEHCPKLIHIRGGEPFYNKDLLNLVKKMPEEICKKTVLHITTNGTQWNKDWAESLRKFRLVRIMVSIDAIGELYEYIRYPASWPQIVLNISEMKKYSNIKLLVHCVVQNLNVRYLGDLINWCKENSLYIQLEQLFDPEYLQIYNLPHHNKKKAVNKLNQLLCQDHPIHVIEFITNCINQLTDSLNQPDNTLLWEKFKTQISMRDNLRGNSYQKFL